MIRRHRLAARCRLMSFSFFSGNDIAFLAEGKRWMMGEVPHDGKILVVQGVTLGKVHSHYTQNIRSMQVQIMYLASSVCFGGPADRTSSIVH